jgi:murein DD-endopeptidase MepM/ murein hydrolase activator NlpD
MGRIYLQVGKKIMNFVLLNFFKKTYNRLQKKLKYSASDPTTFREIWSFNSTGTRVLSLMIILVLLFWMVLSFLFGSGSLSNYFSTNDISIEREELESQNEKIDALTNQIENQENYIKNVKLILKGEIPVPHSLDSLATDILAVNIDTLESRQTNSENSLARKVKSDIFTVKQKTNKMTITYFGTPVVGVISQKFNKKNHPGIDIVTKKGMAVKACLSGTVIYSGYSHKDGHILIIDHGNKFISVYKHNKHALKKTGAKIKLGDPIAIVGNTGENSDGPHLHFELWYNRNPVNPEDYMKFTR